MKLHGIGASGGIAVAPIYYLIQPDLSVTKLTNQDKDLQKKRFLDASAQATEELAQLKATAEKTDTEIAQVFEVHAMMLIDPDFTESVEQLLEEGFNTEYAVEQTVIQLKKMFAAMDSEYMQARAADIQDVGNRLIAILKGVEETNAPQGSNYIVVADDLLPSQTVKLDKKFVLGFVTKQGSVTSHSVILARTMGIPCVVGLGDYFEKIQKTAVIAIDGKSGEVILNPTPQETSEFESRKIDFLNAKQSLEKYRGAKPVTNKGHEVLVVANIGGLGDVQAVLDSDAMGVGLFRSEFIYLQSADFPTEEKQFEIYKEVLSKLAPRPVVIRTLDLGSDKQAPYFNISGEQNPALGYRAIRIGLKQREILRAQLRALIRASAYGNLAVMFPMISHLEQVKAIKEEIQQIKQEFDGKNIPYDKKTQFGIMVETPAAAVISDLLAKEVDFFSIGTNDLTQYTLAVDRMNGNINDLFDSSNVAVLRMIEMTARNAHANGIWVGICGESAANTALTDFYMSIGIDELSVSPSSVLAVKKAVIESK